MKRFLLRGIDHHVAPLEVRERVAVRGAALPRALRRLTQHPAIAEAVIVSTCNRTELHVLSRDPKAAREILVRWFSRRLGGTPAACLQERQGEDAIRHLFRVTAGLDSLVLGECEIAGQVKVAYAAAVRAGTTGEFTNRLLHAAFRCGKDVRTRTELSQGGLSVPHLAIDLAAARLGNLRDRRGLVIGAGETGKLAIRRLIELGARVTIANRTAHRARELAAGTGATVAAFSAWKRLLPRQDLVIFAASAAQPLFTGEDWRRLAKRPLLIDLAVPRTVAEPASERDRNRLVTIDDVRPLADRNRRQREKARRAAELIVDEHVAAFHAWHGQRGAVEIIKQAQARLQDELDRALAAWQRTHSTPDAERLRAAALRHARALLDQLYRRIRAEGRLPEISFIKLARTVVARAEAEP